MVRISFPIPIVTKAKLSRSSKVLKVRLKCLRTDLDIDDAAVTDVPHAVSWHDKYDFHVRRHRHSGRYYYHMEQPRDIAYIELDEVWDSVFYFRTVVEELADDFATATGIDDTRYDIELPDDKEELQDFRPGDLGADLVERQLAIVRKAMEPYRMIRGALYVPVPGPFVIIRKQEPVPVPTTDFYGWGRVFMAYSLADWDRAVEVCDRIGVPKTPGRMNVKVLELHREQFGPFDRELQKLCLVMTFLTQFEEREDHERSLKRAEQTLVNLTQDEQQWLGVFRDCTDQALARKLDPRLDQAFQALMTLDIGPTLSAFARTSHEFSVIRQAISEDMMLDLTPAV